MGLDLDLDRNLLAAALRRSPGTQTTNAPAHAREHDMRLRPEQNTSLKRFSKPSTSVSLATRRDRACPLPGLLRAPWRPGRLDIVPVVAILSRHAHFGEFVPPPRSSIVVDRVGVPLGNARNTLALTGGKKCVDERSWPVF